MWTAVHDIINAQIFTLSRKILVQLEWQYECHGGCHGLVVTYSVHQLAGATSRVMEAGHQVQKTPLILCIQNRFIKAPECVPD